MKKQMKHIQSYGFSQKCFSKRKKVNFQNEYDYIIYSKIPLLVKIINLLQNVFYKI